MRQNLTNRREEGIFGAHEVPEFRGLWVSSRLHFRPRKNMSKKQRFPTYCACVLLIGSDFDLQSLFDWP